QRHGTRPVHVRGLAGHVHGRLLASGHARSGALLRRYTDEPHRSYPEHVLGARVLAGVPGRPAARLAPPRPPVPAPSPSGAPKAWRAFPAPQQPAWPDPAALDRVLDELAAQPPLVFAGEARTLQATLATVASGHGFLLPAGDGAESFAASRADT